jgi:hypothetical protein
MPQTDQDELSRRFAQVADRLSGAIAFSRLLVESLGEEAKDQDARRLADKAQAMLAQLEETRRSFKVFVGQRARLQVSEFEVGCDRLFEKLAVKDDALSPSSIRQHLRNRQGVEPPELADLLKFYLGLEQGPAWSSQRVDKVDLLITQLNQRIGGSDAEQGSKRLRLILERHRSSEHPSLAEIELQTFRKNLETIRSEVEAADSLSQLIDSGTLHRYRRMKHRLGHLMLNPELLPEIITTNLRLQQKVGRLNSRAVNGIFSTYHGIFDIGITGKLDQQLKAELDQLHLDFDQFESSFQQGELRLTQLEKFWRTLKKLAERLEESMAQQPEEPEPSRPPRSTPEEPGDEWLEEDLLALLDSLREHDRKGWPAEHITFSPREGFQIDRREIVAFRRVEEDEADHSLDLFLLKAAALRRSIKRSARKLAKIADSETVRESPGFEIAQQAVLLAESFLARYSQAVDQAIMEGDASEAQRLQILRMRLVRESSGIWLQIHMPE